MAFPQKNVFVLHIDEGGFGKSIPVAEDEDEGNLLGVGDGLPNTSLVLVEHVDMAARPRAKSRFFLKIGKPSIPGNPGKPDKPG